MFILLAASAIFSRFLVMSGVADMLVGMVTRIHLSPIVFMLVAFAICLILGCVLDGISILYYPADFLRALAFGNFAATHLFAVPS